MRGVNPGYPFFIPGVAGHRPPHPPLDTVDDGGLPRHVIVGGTLDLESTTRLDFSKNAGSRPTLAPYRRRAPRSSRRR